MNFLKTNPLETLKIVSTIGPIEKFTKNITKLQKEGFGNVSQKEMNQVYRDMLMLIFYVVLIAYCVMDVNERELGMGGYIIAIFFPHIYIVFVFLKDLFEGKNLNSGIGTTSKYQYNTDSFSDTSEMILGQTPL
jgi:hypothetical protein